MQAVILAAGKGTRMGELTRNYPKPMLEIAGKNLLEYKLEILPDNIDEIIFVVGYQKDKIVNYFGNKYKGKQITYVEMFDLNGTGSALWNCRHLLHDKFLVMMGDDIYFQDDLIRVLEHDWAILIKQVKKPVAGGNISISADYNFVGIKESTDFVEGFVNTGLYVLQKEIFKYELVDLGNGEYGLPQTLSRAAKDFPVRAILTDNWHQVSRPEDLVLPGFVR